MKTKTEVFNMQYCTWEVLHNYVARKEGKVVSCTTDGRVTIEYQVHDPKCDGQYCLHPSHRDIA